jgi:hypothetical protein
MSRFLTLWLTLLGAFWLTRSLASALLFGAVGRGYGEAFQVAAIPLLQALLIAWVTRRPRSPGPPSPGGEQAVTERKKPLL